MHGVSPQGDETVPEVDESVQADLVFTVMVKRVDTNKESLLMMFGVKQRGTVVRRKFSSKYHVYG